MYFACYVSAASYTDTISIHVLYQIVAFFSTFLPYNFLILHNFCGEFGYFSVGCKQSKRFVSTKHVKTRQDSRELKLNADKLLSHFNWYNNAESRRRTLVGHLCECYCASAQCFVRSSICIGHR